MEHRPKHKIEAEKIRQEKEAAALEKYKLRAIAEMLFDLGGQEKIEGDFIEGEKGILAARKTLLHALDDYVMNGLIDPGEAKKLYEMIGFSPDEAIELRKEYYTPEWTKPRQ